jgi:hypothetical protein
MVLGYFMILSYGGKNCWSYKEWLEVDFTVNKKYVPESYCFPKTRILPFLCFEGSNASGKTCALKVLAFIFYFCKQSFGLEPESGIPYDTFFNNNEKSQFFLLFNLNDTDEAENIYEYTVTLDKNRVHSETLKVKQGKERKKIIVKRNLNKVNDGYFNSSKEIIYRNNVSFFSTLFQYDVPKSKKFFDFFSTCYSNVTYYGKSFGEPFDTDQFYYNNGSITFLV